MALSAWCLASAASLELDSKEGDEEEVRSCCLRPEDVEAEEEAAAIEATVRGRRMAELERSTERAEVNGRRGTRGEAGNGSCWVLERSWRGGCFSNFVSQAFLLKNKELEQVQSQQRHNNYSR